VGYFLRSVISWGPWDPGGEWGAPTDKGVPTRELASEGQRGEERTPFAWRLNDRLTNPDMSVSAATANERARRRQRARVRVLFYLDECVIEGHSRLSG
jgi:hypothetical protein